MIQLLANNPVLIGLLAVSVIGLVAVFGLFFYGLPAPHNEVDAVDTGGPYTTTKSSTRPAKRTNEPDWRKSWS